DRHAEVAARLHELLVAGLLVERWLHAGAAVQLWTDGDVVVAELLHGGHRLARQHRVDATDLVADFPADLEDLERSLRHIHLAFLRSALATSLRRWSTAVIKVTNAACGESYGLKYSCTS